MDINYTALDIASFQKERKAERSPHESFDVNAIFLSLIVITLAILALFLFILIQKKMQELAFIGLFA